jgi:hypothetical protein
MPLQFEFLYDLFDGFHRIDPVNPPASNGEFINLRSLNWFKRLAWTLDFECEKLALIATDYVWHTPLICGHNFVELAQRRKVPEIFQNSGLNLSFACFTLHALPP